MPMTAATPLSDAWRRALRQVAAMMIPASADFGVPGADDEAIFADILRSLGRDDAAVRGALRQLCELAGGDFDNASAETRRRAVQKLRQEHSTLTTVLVNVVVRCYYRDDRVMRALGMEPRPPFPKGFEVESGDWSLLDPVRQRGRIWREAPPVQR